LNWNCRDGCCGRPRRYRKGGKLPVTASDTGALDSQALFHEEAEASVNAWTGPLKVFSIGMPVASRVRVAAVNPAGQAEELEAERFAGLLVVRGYVQLGSGGGGADAIGVKDPESKNIQSSKIHSCISL